MPECLLYARLWQALTFQINKMCLAIQLRKQACRYYNRNAEEVAQDVSLISVLLRGRRVNTLLARADLESF